MKLILTIISFSLLLSQQLQVDGNLKVEGNIDASGNPITNVGAPQAVTDALNLQTLNNMMTDDTQYEYDLYVVTFDNYTDANNNPMSTWYKQHGSTSGSYDWISKLNELSIDGWKISNILENSGKIFFFIKKPLEQD